MKRQPEQRDAKLTVVASSATMVMAPGRSIPPAPFQQAASKLSARFLYVPVAPACAMGPSSGRLLPSPPRVGGFMPFKMTGAPLKRIAPITPNPTPPSKKVSVNPYDLFCREQRPLLLRTGLRNGDRERLLGMRWKSLSAAEKGRFKVGREQSSALAPAPAKVLKLPAPAPAPTPPAPAPSVSVAPNLSLASTGLELLSTAALQHRNM